MIVQQITTSGIGLTFLKQGAGHPLYNRSITITQSPRISAQQIIEEVFNSITHGLGALVGLVGLIIGLLTFSAPISFTISYIFYGVCLVLLMTVSSLYHALKFTRAARVFKTLDHSAIYLLIAGTCTPFIIVLYGGWMQLLLLSIAWLLAVTGIVLKATLPKIMSKFGVGVYIAMGWLGLALLPKLSGLSTQVIWLVLVGGILYTVGASLLIIKKPFVHVAWHIFVVVAASIHFIAITKLA